MSTESHIKCPNCGTDINVNNILSHQLEEEIRQKYQAQLTEEKQKYQKEKDALNNEKEVFEQQKKQHKAIFEERLEKQLKEERIAIESKLKTKFSEEQADQFKLLQD